MANKTPTKTSFNKDNQPSKGRGKSERNKILEAFSRMSKTEDDFYNLLATKVFLEDDSFTFKEVLSRLYPISKSTSPLVTFEFNEKGTPYEQAQQVIKAMSDGHIPPDVGKLFVDGIQSMLKIQEVTDIDERLKAIEAITKDGE